MLDQQQQTACRHQTAEISWFDEPYDVPGEPSNTEVCSTITVETVPVELV
jgi:hypothetical protein